jgi:hypothetical protein
LLRNRALQHYAKTIKFRCGDQRHSDVGVGKCRRSLRLFCTLTWPLQRVSFLSHYSCNLMPPKHQALATNFPLPLSHLSVFSLTLRVGRVACTCLQSDKENSSPLPAVCSRPCQHHQPDWCRGLSKPDIFSLVLSPYLLSGF